MYVRILTLLALQLSALRLTEHLYAQYPQSLPTTSVQPGQPHFANADQLVNRIHSSPKETDLY
jgi:hypothetical protein